MITLSPSSPLLLTNTEAEYSGTQAAPLATPTATTVAAHARRFVPEGVPIVYRQASGVVATGKIPTFALLSPSRQSSQSLTSPAIVKVLVQ